MSALPAIVVALNRELRSVRRAFPAADAHMRAAWRVSGIGPRRAAHTASELYASGHDALACIGLAGGLSPELRCGDLVVGSAVLDAEGIQLSLDGAWARAVVARLGEQLPLHHGLICSASAVVAEPRAKRELFSRTGALVVDMECAAVAHVASQTQRRALALRVVVDDQSCAVPHPLLDMADAEGNLPAGVALPRLLGAPGLAVDAMKLALRVRRAERSLRRALHLLGPSLACPTVTG